VSSSGISKYSRATLIGPPCAKPAEGSSSWKVPVTVLLVLLVIASSRQKAVQASERGPVHGKVHLAKGPISVAPLYICNSHTRGMSC
jgi:hypothetical protein